MFYLGYTGSTGATGPYCKSAKRIRIIGMDLVYTNHNRDYGEVRLYFDSREWNVDVDGYIYGDAVFLRRLKRTLNEKRYSIDIGYSRRGISAQGRDYVTMECFQPFIRWYMQNVSEYHDRTFRFHDGGSILNLYDIVNKEFYTNYYSKATSRPPWRKKKRLTSPKEPL